MCDSSLDECLSVVNRKLESNVGRPYASQKYIEKCWNEKQIPNSERKLKQQSDRKKNCWDELSWVCTECFCVSVTLICIRQLIKRFFLNWWVFFLHSHPFCFVGMNAYKQRSTFVCLVGAMNLFVLSFFVVFVFILIFSVQLKGTAIEVIF